MEEILTSSNYKTQGTLSNEENILERTLTSKDAKYQIPVSEIYNGNLETSQSAKTISFTIFFQVLLKRQHAQQLKVRLGMNGHWQLKLGKA